MVTADCGWGHCRVGARAVPCVPSCVVALCDDGATRTYSGTYGTVVMQLGRPMWRRVSCEQQLHRMSDLSMKLGCFGSCGWGAVLLRCFRAHFGAEHCLPFKLWQWTRHRHGSKALQGSKVILSVAPVSTCLFITTFEQKRKKEKKKCLFITTFEHGSGAFVLTCGCYWITVSMEYATGETSGY